MSITAKLTTFAEHNLNVLIIGNHGIGKTTVAKDIAKTLDLNFKYYSAPTLDPWADIVGVPKPSDTDQYLDFYRPRGLEEAEFIMFDELNRAHPKVLNAVLEIIQFKSINGEPLSNLKMVWAAINPPGGKYQVEDMDPVLFDRFHVYVNMHADINTEYLSQFMSLELAQVLRNWWIHDLGNELKDKMTPRRIEYIGTLIQKGVDYKDALPPDSTWPRQSLDKRLEIMRGIDTDFVINTDTLVTRLPDLLERLKTHPDIALKIAEQAESLDSKEWFMCRDLIEALPKELVYNILNDKFCSRREELKQAFEASHIDAAKDYPKMYEAADFDNI